MNALPTLCLDRARDHARRIMAGEGAEHAQHPGWLAGLPVSIKDLTDVAGVRTTYGSPIFRDHVPTASHPLVERIEAQGGIVIGKSNTPEFGAGGSTFNEVFGRTRNPWNTALTCGGTTGGGAVSVATGEAWLAHGTDHAGSLRRPGTYCCVVGLRPSPGRVTRGAPNNLFSPLSVQGPMARSVADVALFLDTMAGWDIRDPLTYEAPAVAYAASLAPRPLRVAFTADFNGALPVDRETRAICEAAVQRFTEAGCTVEDAAPDLGRAAGSLPGAAQPAIRGRPRAAAAIPPRPAQARHHLEHRARPGGDAEPPRLGGARAGGLVPAAGGVLRPLRRAGDAGRGDAGLRRDAAASRERRGQEARELHGGSMLNASITLAGCPAVAVPAGFDQYGRPVGLQVAAPPRQDALALMAAAMFEAITGLDRMLPIDPRPGVVPPVEAAA